MIRLTLEDDNGTYSVELKQHGDSIHYVVDTFVGVLNAAGFAPSTIGQYILTEETKEDCP